MAERTRHYLNDFTVDTTPQSEAIEGTVPNSAGGYSFEVDKWTQLERFLILGSEGGTYYIKQKKLTRDNAKSAIECIKEDGVRTLITLLNISKSGRAPKNDPALFVHALASVEGDEKTRSLAFRTLKDVARIGTHLFHWAEFRNQFGGWGIGARKAVESWYTSKDVDRLGYQLIKYKQRDGWAHLDLLRLAHVKPSTDEYSALFAYAKACAKGTKMPEGTARLLPEQVRQAELLKDCNKKNVVNAIIDYKLPREVVPTKYLNDPEVWEALLTDMPVTAMVRNLGNMSKVGLLKDLSAASKIVIIRLQDEKVLQKSRIHPIQLLAAQRTYSSGKGLRGSAVWKAVSTVVDALEDAFYASFKHVEPTGKGHVLGVDVSGSMTCGNVAGMESLTPSEGAAVMAMVTARTEPNYVINGFTDEFVDLKISARDTLNSAMDKVQKVNFKSTDCAVPMKWALRNKIEAEAFIVYTDSETWCGSQHPVEALRKYRQKMGIPAKLIVVAFMANQFTIADPKDAGMLDLVGFDSAAPAVMADFIRN